MKLALQTNHTFETKPGQAKQAQHKSGTCPPEAKGGKDKLLEDRTAPLVVVFWQNLIVNIYLCTISQQENLKAFFRTREPSWLVRYAGVCTQAGLCVHTRLGQNNPNLDMKLSAPWRRFATSLGQAKDPVMQSGCCIDRMPDVQGRDTCCIASSWVRMTMEGGKVLICFVILVYVHRKYSWFDSGDSFESWRQTLLL